MYGCEYARNDRCDSHFGDPALLNNREVCNKLLVVLFETMHNSNSKLTGDICMICLWLCTACIGCWVLQKWVKICHKEIQQLFLVFSSKSIQTNIKLNVIVSLINQIIWMYNCSLQLKSSTQNKATCTTLYKVNSTPSSLSDYCLNSHSSNLAHFLCKNIVTHSLIFCLDQKANFLTIK